MSSPDCLVDHLHRSVRHAGAGRHPPGEEELRIPACAGMVSTNSIVPGHPSIRLRFSVPRVRPAALRGAWACGGCWRRAGRAFLDAFIAAVEVVDAVDRGLAVGDQRGDDQAGRGAQVGGHDRRAAQLRRRRVTMAVLPCSSMSAPMRCSSCTCMKRFSKMVSLTVASPVGDGVEGHELGLHVGGKGRIGRRHAH